MKRGEVQVIDDSLPVSEHIATLGPGEYFGEIGLLQDVPRTATVVALGDDEVLTLARSDFDELVVSHESVARRLQTVAGRRSHGLRRVS